MPPEKAKQLRGFALWTPERRKAVASMGGKAVPPERRSFSIDRKLAARAGKKGGRVIPLAKTKSTE